MADPPLYTVTVYNYQRGWTYSVTQGVAPDLTQPVQLADALLYKFGFPGQQIPSGVPTPSQVEFALWCRDATEVPEVQIGDLVGVDVRLGTSGPRIAAPPPMTVASAEAQVNLPRTAHPEREYTTLLPITLVDTRASLPTLFPQPRNSFAQRSNQQLWRPRLAEVAAQIGYSIGCPTWWPDLTGPVGVQGRDLASDGDGTTWESDASKLLEGLVNTHQPNGVTHTLVPYYGAGYPTATNGGAYRWVGPTATTYTAWDGDTKNVWAPGPAIGDPNTDFKFLIVPASRIINAHSDATLDANWCNLPVTARRAREHVIESVTIGGDERHVASADGLTGSVTVRKSTRNFGVATPGAATRAVHAYAFLGDSADSSYYGGITPDHTSPVGNAIAARFISDPSTRAAWVYDQFSMFASRVPDAQRAAVLPYICPRPPGEPNGDGHVVRRFSIGNVSPAALLPDSTIPGGFLAAGSLAITGGDLRFDLTLTPGNPL